MLILLKYRNVKSIKVYTFISILILIIIILLRIIEIRNRSFNRQSIHRRLKEFQCRNHSQFFSETSFYEVDCENPFLKALVDDTTAAFKSDVCKHFSPLYRRISTEFRSFSICQQNDFNEILQACPECHHLQVIDGKLFYIRRSTSTDYQTRSRSVKSLFKYVLDTFPDLPNMEFLIHVGDSVIMRKNRTHHAKCPVFGFTKNKNDIVNGTYKDGIVSIPCFSFWNWPEARIDRWNKKMMSIRQAGNSRMFHEKFNQVFWRGAETGHRTKLIHMIEKHRTIMNVSFMNWRGAGFLWLSTHKEYRTLEEHCNFKYLLHLEGNTFSGRLKYLLLCGSPVIFAKFNGWEEFWYHLLKHEENILIFERQDEALLLNMTNYLFENSKRATQIGINGQTMILKYLNEQAIICYMRNILFAYSKLIRYSVTKHTHAREFV